MELMLNILHNKLQYVCPADVINYHDSDKDMMNLYTDRQLKMVRQGNGLVVFPGN